MNLEILKSGFMNYMQNLREDNFYKGNDSDFTNLDDVSIFMHAKEFKDYLKQEYNINTDDLSKSINDILKMEIVNGKLVNPEEETKGNENLENNPSNKEDENTEVQETKTSDQADKTIETAEENAEEFSLTNIFNAFLEDEDFAKAVDTNQDGEYTKEELTEFFGHINSYDGDEENLSFEDLISAAKDIKIHSFEIEDSEVGKKENDKPASNSVGGGYANGGYTDGSFTNGGYTGGSIGTKEKNLDNMTAEELNAELGTAQADLSKNQTDLENAISGNTPELIQLKNNIDEAYNKYQEELKSVDEDMAKKLDDIVQEVEDKESEIKNKELEIANQEQAVSDSESAYNNAVSAREALDGQLDILQTASANEDDTERKAEIASAIESLKSQIERAKEAEKDAEDARDDAKDKLDNLNDEKTELEEQLEELNSSKSELEEQIAEKYPEIAKYQQAYNNEKNTYVSRKNNAINIEKGKVSESQKYVNNVKSALNDRDIKDLTKENLSAVSGFSQYNEEKGKALAEMALKLYGNDYVANGNCAGGVANIIQNVLGYRTYGNGCDYGEVLAGYPDDWSEVTEEITCLEDLKHLPAGAIVSWSTYDAGHTASNGKYGHVWMSDGQGHEISDFIADVCLKYGAEWHATYRVYIPV